MEREKLYSSVDRKRDTLVADLKKLSKRVDKMMMEFPDDVILEGHYAVDVVSPEKVDRILVLRRDPQELKEILRERDYKEEKVKENLAAEILDVCLYDAVSRCGINKVCEINTTGRKAIEVLEEILQILDGQKKCRIGLVDWLGKLESEGKLDEYLKDL